MTWCGDGVCSQFIAHKLGVSQPTYGEHLKILSRVGLIRGTKIKQWMFYRRDDAVSPPRMTEGRLLPDANSSWMKSWSAVPMTRSRSRARLRMAWSSVLVRPISPTCTASCPATFR